jgi:hypothetical protein
MERQQGKQPYADADRLEKRIPSKRYPQFRVLPPQPASPVSTDIAWSPRLGLSLSDAKLPSVSEGPFLVSRFIGGSLTVSPVGVEIS